MSRIPQPSSVRTPLKPSTPSKSRVAPSASTPSKVRAPPISRAKTPTKAPKPPVESFDAPPTTSLSIKEAIALKRAEAKKAQAKSVSGLDNFVALDDALPVSTPKQEDEDVLGRLSVRETIERARSTGSLNLSTRSLPCLPSGLFEIHLSITPDRLKSVPDEPPLPEPSLSDPPARRGGRRDAPAWFEAQDLQILKAWNNDIVEIQHEISLFGSLKTVDLHKNKLASLPNTFGDLTALTTLDLSHNCLSSLPDNIFALPELTILNISHNTLTALPFNAPFASADGRSRPNQSSGGSFFTPTITRATAPLPRLLTLDASHNQISASAIDLKLPVSITKLDLSSNPLGLTGSHSKSLIKALGACQRLKELRFENAEIGDDAFQPSMFDSAPFPSLRILDLGESKVTPDAVKVALRGMKQEISYDMTTDEPPAGVTCVIVGKKVLKEPWELELDRRAKSRTVNNIGFDAESNLPSARVDRTVVNARRKQAPKEIVKEDWEIEAEQGLSTEGGKRRARAAAAAAAAEDSEASLGLGQPTTPRPGHSPTPSTSILSLSSPQYYAQASNTLTLPPSAPPSKAAGHARAFSLAAPSMSTSSSFTRTTDIAVPAPTLPLSVIVTEPFAQTLKVLVLINRRMDRSFALPFLSENGGPSLLPNLEELNLEGCGLSDVVAVTHSDPSSGAATPPRSSEPILPLITRLFPSLRTLNLSYNTLTSASLTVEALSSLIIAAPHRKGLKHLRLRGNRLSGLEGFQGVAESFKGNREVPGWNLEELDLRDNEIGKLLPEVGLLPLDVFLVDGNIFRVPQSRVWEREGTKGLLSWLRGRIE